MQNSQLHSQDVRTLREIELIKLNRADAFIPFVIYIFFFFSFFIILLHRARKKKFENTQQQQNAFDSLIILARNAYRVTYERASMLSASINQIDPRKQFSVLTQRQRMLHVSSDNCDKDSEHSSCAQQMGQKMMKVLLYKIETSLEILIHHNNNWCSSSLIKLFRFCSVVYFVVVIFFIIQRHVIAMTARAHVFG